MKKEDAIKYLKQLYPYGGHCWLDIQRTEAIGMAIEALKEEPTIATVGKPKEAEGALKELLDNIDEKELTKVREEMMQEEPSIPEIVDEHSWEMLGEEPVSEDLEETIDTYLATYFGSEKEKQEWPFLKKMAIHFAEWQKQKDSIPVSEDLEKAATEYVKSSLVGSPSVKKNAFKAGAKWQREKDESTTDDLGEYINELSKQFPEVSFAKLSRIAVRVAKWQNRQEYTCYEEAFEDGAKWKVENLWKPADGDDLPEIDREVVVFTQNFPNDVGMMSVAIAHRPNPDGWDGKSLSTGKVEHYTPKTYDKGGWNIPNIKYWLDCLMPKEEDEL